MRISRNIAVIPSAAQPACLVTNEYGLPTVAFAITADAENTITSPNRTSNITVPNSHLSTPTRFAISTRSLYCLIRNATI